MVAAPTMIFYSGAILTAHPTPQPMGVPTVDPTLVPTVAPTLVLTVAPTFAPSPAPTDAKQSPTALTSTSSTATPSDLPTAMPSASPSASSGAGVGALAAQGASSSNGSSSLSAGTVAGACLGVGLLVTLVVAFVVYVRRRKVTISNATLRMSNFGHNDIYGAPASSLRAASGPVFIPHIEHSRRSSRLLSPPRMQSHAIELPGRRNSAVPQMHETTINDMHSPKHIRPRLNPNA